MFTLEQLSQKVNEYRDRGSLSDFEGWFEDNCAGAYDDAELRSVCIAIDAALSEYHYDHIEEAVLKQELATAVRPFVRSPELSGRAYGIAIGQYARRPVCIPAFASVVVAIALVVGHDGTFSPSVSHGLLTEEPVPLMVAEAAMS